MQIGAFIFLFFYPSTIKYFFLREEIWRSGCSEERWAIYILLGKMGVISHYVNSH